MARAPASAADPGPWTADDLSALRAILGPQLRVPQAGRWVDPLQVFFTGYYEPELPAARAPDARFHVALHRRPAHQPAGAPADPPWLTRAEIEDTGALAGHEIAFVEDATEAYLAQVQGSVRLRLGDGTLLRLGYDGRNGHPYASLGQMLVARGRVPAADISADAIRAHARAHPGEAATLRRQNASYVFFREIAGLAADAGPVGAAGVPLTALRSVAIDPAHVPLGTLLWIETEGPDPVRGLVVAQDTGSAIRGAGRCDIFFGSGAAAGQRAGSFRRGGRMLVLAGGEGA